MPSPPIEYYSLQLNNREGEGAQVGETEGETDRGTVGKTGSGTEKERQTVGQGKTDSGTEKERQAEG